LLFVVSGPGGVGKDTIASRLVAGDPSLRLGRSWTTRPRRPGETDESYRFVTRAEFDANVDAGGFLEWAEYLGERYGTPLPDLDHHDDDRDVILVIEVQGAAQVLDRVPGSVMVLVVPPSREALRERMQRRGDGEEAVERRLAIADHEMRAGRALAQHIVVNDDLGGAVAEVAGILGSYRPRRQGA
jgi:guanylate kinase